jgi:hypothetical protein
VFEIFPGIGEYRLRLKGAHYWPINSTDCSPSSVFNGAGKIWCKYEVNQFHSIPGPLVCRKRHESLDVGIVDYWPLIEPKSFAVVLNNTSWYIDTCDPYEIAVSKEFNDASSFSICWSAEAIAAYRSWLGVVAQIQGCLTWTSPAESFVWYLEMTPACCH